MDRKTELLIAVYKLLNKQNECSYVLNMLSETVYYDEAECDGSCLLDDIKYCLEEDGIEI